MAQPAYAGREDRHRARGRAAAGPDGAAGRHHHDPPQACDDARQHTAVITKFEAIGATAIHDPRQPVFAIDHDIQNQSPANLAKYATIEAFARQHGVDFYPAGTGISHQVMVEQGYVVPGSMVVASDSHSNLYGALLLPRHAGRAHRRRRALGDRRHLVAGAAGRPLHADRRAPAGRRRQGCHHRAVRPVQRRRCAQHGRRVHRRRASPA